MKKSVFTACGGIVAVLSLLAISSTGARAMTVQECSTKYNVAKAAGTLGDKTWNDFRKSDCGEGTTAAASPAAPAAPSAAQAPVAAAAPAPAAAPTPATGAAVFPAAVATKYASEKASRARMQTCLDQYKANKTANANGGLKWIMKGGGYYSECNKRLKGVKA